MKDEMYTGPIYISMKPIEKYVYLGAIIFLICAYFFKGCNNSKTTKTETVIKDTSTLKYRLIIAENVKDKENWNGTELRLRDNITNLESKIAGAKGSYNASKQKYKSVVKDSLTTDSMCLQTLGFADSYIQFQDSLIQTLTHGLDSCFQFTAKQNITIKKLQEISDKCSKEQIYSIMELSRFRHLIFRLYRKRK